MPALLELEQAYKEARRDPKFRAELERYSREYVGRPTPLYFCANLTRALGGAKIYLKREDLCHTGAHKVNNTLGQALLAVRMDKSAHHGRDRRRPAWRGHRDDGGAVPARMRSLHGHASTSNANRSTSFA